MLHLLRRTPHAACLVMFALRPGDRGARLLTAARATPGWEHVPLGPLSDEAARALLVELPDAAVCKRVIGEAAGNPLFLRELGRLARHGETALPATLTAAVGLDVAALEPTARALLAGAAVAGDPFDPELAAAAAGVEPDAAALDRLVAAELVRSVPHPPGRWFAFRHPLVRRAVYDRAAPAWRLNAHERAAAALERRGVAPAVRAYHVERSALVGGRVGDRAPVRGRRGGEPRFAGGLRALVRRRALELLFRMDDDVAMRLPVQLDHCVIHVSDWDASNAFYRDVLGAELVEVGHRWAYRLGSQQLNVHGPGIDPTPVARLPVQPGNSDLCFAYDGPIEDAIAHLGAHDVPIELGPIERSGARGPGLSVYFRDPDGSLLEFITYQ